MTSICNLQKILTEYQLLKKITLKHLSIFFTSKYLPCKGLID